MPVADPTLEPMLHDAKVQVLTQREELENLLAFQGDDICMFVYSTAVKDVNVQMIIRIYADLARLVDLGAKNANKLKFIGYDLNQLGPHELIINGAGD